MALAFSLNIRVLVLAIILLPILLSLGQWQLHRASEKQAILVNHQAQTQRMPVDFPNILDEKDFAFLPVKLIGEFDADHILYLDNKVYLGKVGYEVLVPFQHISGEWVMVNIGWIKAPPLRSELPPVSDLPEGEITLLAQVYVPPEAAYDFAKNEAPSRLEWPRRQQVLDVVAIEKELKRDMFPYQLRLNDDQPGALTIDWPTINVSPAKHRAYAFQWFAMATGLVLWLLIASFKSRRQT